MIAKLLSWNVNGLRAAAKKGFLDYMQEINPDVICLQEIKAKEEQLPPEVQLIPGYRSYFFPAQRPGYSGVAVYSKLEPLWVQYGLGEERFDQEGRVLLLDFANFRLLNAYFPNGGANEERLRYKLDFSYAVLDFAKAYEAQTPQRPMLICGDVNTAHREIDLARPKENVTHSGFMPIEREWVDAFLGIGFLDTFRLFCDQPGQYSWWDMKTHSRERNVGWRIDYFFASEKLRPRLKGAAILPEIYGSDHCPVTVDLEI